MRSIWLASYPKSGNTWFRMLVANLSAANEEAADINDLKIRGGMASDRSTFDSTLMIESGLLTHEEIDRLRPRVYQELARETHDGNGDDDEDLACAPPARFVKTHDAYTLNTAGVPLLAGRRGADGAIVIVRDPRDVASSLAHHNGRSIDHAIDFMNDSNAGFCAERDRQHRQLRQLIPGWSRHNATWLDQTDIPVHPIRYEDLAADTSGTLKAALQFAQCPANDREIHRAAVLADFPRLRAQEDEKGFQEAPRPGSGTKFFRKGQAGGWRNELTMRQIERIETAHAAMMKRFGYELVSKGRSARAGMK